MNIKHLLVACLMVTMLLAISGIAYAYTSGWVVYDPYLHFPGTNNGSPHPNMWCTSSGLCANQQNYYCRQVKRTGSDGQEYVWCADAHLDPTNVPPAPDEDEIPPL